MRKALPKLLLVVSSALILINAFSGSNHASFFHLADKALNQKMKSDATHQVIKSDAEFLIQKAQTADISVQADNREKISIAEVKADLSVPVFAGPVFSNCPSAITVSSDPSYCGQVVNYTAPTATVAGVTFSSTEYYTTSVVKSFAVPANVTSVTFKAIGGPGGTRGANLGGKGASMQGDFAVTPGETIYYIIGQRGAPGGATTNGGGGGGATWISRDASFSDKTKLLLVAGGGGGASFTTTGSTVADANITLDANDGAYFSSGASLGYSSGDGGKLTNFSLGGKRGTGGGAAGTPNTGGTGGAGGAAFSANGDDAISTVGTALTSPQTTTGTGGISPANAIASGNMTPTTYSYAFSGGFGGGGSGVNAGGGGGGYNGGGGGSRGNITAGGTTSGCYGGGGGSYNGGTNQVNAKGGSTSGTQATNQGSVTITYTTTPTVTVTQTAGLPSGSVFPVGTTTNTFKAVDSDGNVAFCSFM